MSKFFLALLAYTLLVQAGLVSAVRFRVLTTGPDGCTKRKQDALQKGINEAMLMTDAAITALANPQVINSPAFLDFLGKGNNPATISANHFQSLKGSFNSQLVTLTTLSGAGANDITFICPPDAEELAQAPLENPDAKDSQETCDGFFFALARNKANLVKVCPVFFDKRVRQIAGGGTKDVLPKALAVAANDHRTGATMGGCPAMTLVHELQHLSRVVGQASRAKDLPSTLDPISGKPPGAVKPGDPQVVNPSYTVAQCKILSSSDKIKNAQNFAWFAMDVFAEKSRGLPCGTPPTSPVATGSGSGSGSRSGSPKPPVKPLARRAPPKKAVTPAAGKKVTTAAPPKKAVPVAAPKKAVTPATGKKVTTAAPPKKAVPVVAAPKKAVPVVAAPKKAVPVVAAPKKVTTPAAPKKVAAPAPVAAKPNPLGGGTAPSGPRLARPARLSSSPVPKPTPAKQPAAGTGAKNGAKVGAGAKPASGARTSSSAKPTSTGKVPPATACKVLRRAGILPISKEGVSVD